MTEENKMKILVVDDAVTVRMYHRQLLEMMGYDVDEAENGVEAIEKSLQTDYGLFLIDVNMPKMDGYTLVTEIRANDALSHIPIIMISTEAQSHDKSKALEAGANYYMIKPIKQPEMEQVVQLLLGSAE